MIPTFPQDISLKMNVIAWLEFEPAYQDVTVQHISYNTTETTPFRNLYARIDNSFGVTFLGLLGVLRVEWDL